MILHNLSIFIQQYNRSPHWPKVRKNHLVQYPSCAACGSKKDLEVHHIEPFNVNPDRELDSSNLITLCSRYCHFSIGHLMDYNSWNINVIEDARVYLDKVTNRPYRVRSTNYEGSSNLYYHIFSWFYGFWRNDRSTK